MRSVHKVLVVAPASVCAVWPKELAQYAAFPVQARVLDGDRKRRLLTLADLDAEPGKHLRVAVINYESTYRLVGFDSMEEDYYSLASYDSELAYTESGKKLMRRTKADMLSIIGQCVGVTLAVIDLRQSYDYLKATMDILRDKNTSMLQIIKEIDAAYEAANEAGFEHAWREECKSFDALLKQIPDRTWLE